MQRNAKKDSDFDIETNSFLSKMRMPVYFRAQSARIHAHRPQAGFLSGAKRSCTCQPAAGWFSFGREAPVYNPFGREAPVYMPTGLRPVSFGREAPVYMSIGRRAVFSRARSARVHAHRPQAFAALRRSSPSTKKEHCLNSMHNYLRHQNHM